MRYSLDTSSLISAWNTFYPPDVFPSLWDNISEAAQSGIIQISDFVYQEIQAEQKEGDPLSKWVKKRRNHIVFPTSEEVQLIWLEIQNEHYLEEDEDGNYSFVDPKQQQENADPLVIALARCHDCAVVTEEKFIKDPETKRVKIPNVCEKEGVPWMNLLRMIKAEKWQF